MKRHSLARGQVIEIECMRKFSDFLPAYINAYWLRPVTAVVRSLEAEILGFDEFKGKKNLELACGDGTNGHLAMGGTLPLEWDVFQSLPLVSAAEFFEGKLDVYNSFEEDISKKCAVTPGNGWTKGIDHKSNLLKKAELLGAYGSLECRDLNQGLNESDNTYDLVFSNSLYWLTNVKKILLDIHGCLKSGGVAKLSIIKSEFIDEMAWTKLGNYEFKKYFDMGRHDHYQQLVSEQVWEGRFTEAGFRIVSKIPTFNKKLAHMIEFHDLREISPLTSFMTRSLNQEDLKAVKARWIEYMAFLAERMYEENFFEATDKDSLYNIYVLQKD